jgi:diacylglycerol O-acyltransferase/trehalose O-mycolyltransferase
MRLRLPITVAAMVCIAASIQVPALAGPPAPPPAIDAAVTNTRTVSQEAVTPQRTRLFIASLAMRRIVAVDILHGTGVGPAAGALPARWCRR